MHGTNVVAGFKEVSGIGSKGGALPCCQGTFPPSALQTGQASWPCIRLSSIALSKLLVGRVVMAHLTDPTPQLCLLFQAGLSHVTPPFLNSFGFGEPIGMVSNKRSGSCATALTSFLRRCFAFQSFLLAAPGDPTGVAVGLFIIYPSGCSQG